jgi:hypothetical protein
MTSAHFFFIPSIFFLGLFVGAAISNYLTQSTAEKHKDTRTSKTTRWLLASTFGIFSIIFIITHMVPFMGGAKSLHATLGHQPLFDQHTSSTAVEVYDRLERFGEVGREAYKRFTYTGDVVFPLSLLFFLIVLVYFVRERISLSSMFRIILISAPILWFLSDMAENSVIYFLISQYPQKNILLAELLAPLTNLKFTLLLGSIALPITSYVLFRNKGKK